MPYTPMMLQYFEIKEQYKDCIVFYRLGDFYEMFFEDAKTASAELGLTLTGRDCGMEERAPMCGVPFHSSEGYIVKLVSRGYKVAICEQTEDPAAAKGIVKRGVIRVVTPSTVMSESAVESSRNNFLVSVYKENGQLGVAFLDFSTGEFFATEIKEEIYHSLNGEVARLMPSEALLSPEAACDENIVNLLENAGCYITYDTYDYFDKSGGDVDAHFAGKCQIKEDKLTKKAIGGALLYILQTQKVKVSHINAVTYYEMNQYVYMDSSTRRNLELSETLRTKSRKGSLIWVLDKTKTAMGARLLRRWIDQPLLSRGVIEKRLSGVEELYGNVMLRDGIREKLEYVLDIERLLGRIVCKSAIAKDLLSLKESLKALPAIIFDLECCTSEMLTEIACDFDTLEDVKNLIELSIKDDAPVSLREGGIIKDNYSEKLDELRRALTEGSSWLADVEADERERTGIKNLKVKFNKVFGYYIEVSRSNLDKVPEDYIRKQTTVNAERFITQRLKEIEDMVLGAKDKIDTLEYAIFEDIREKVAAEQERIQATARKLATLDCIASFAETAVKFGYVKPQINSDGRIEIKQGRHPVVERLTSEMFVPNDTLLDKDENRFNIITGPNMAGKSTYMRQIAIITLMAQIGSFVPAESADIGIVDGIFTRIGASDDLASGQSTFMVEMNEVANILKNATSSSLIVYDEIGRGTSTYDGLAIAWAVAEYTADKSVCGAKTLFATHYHELTELENKIDGVKNYSVAIKERDGNIIFLRKIVNGGADNSYGVEVARLTGIPDDVICRAREILKKLENGEIEKTVKKAPEQAHPSEALMLIEELRKIDIDTLTPIESMNILYKLKKLL